MRAPSFAVLGLGAVLAAGPVSAQTIYENGPNGSENGNEMSAWVQAEDFSTVGNVEVSAVRFWAFGFDESAYSGSIYWQILSSNEGSPGSLLGGGLVTPTVTPWGAVAGHGYVGYQLDFVAFSPVALSEGEYWLALHNGPLVQTSRQEFYWAQADGNGSRAGQEDPSPFDGAWYGNGSEHAFVLYGAQQSVVPEPATIVLTATGLTLLAFGARRRRSRYG